MVSSCFKYLVSPAVFTALSGGVPRSFPKSRRIPLTKPSPVNPKSIVAVLSSTALRAASVKKKWLTSCMGKQ